MPSPGSNSTASLSHGGAGSRCGCGTGSGAWLAVPRTTSSRFATGPGARERTVAVGELPVGDQLREVFQVLGQVLVGDHVVQRQPDRGELAGQVLGVSLGAGGDLAVSLGGGAVRSSCRFCASRISGAAYAAWVEKARLSRMYGYGSQWWYDGLVERDPEDHEQRLAEQVLAGARNRARPSENRPNASASYRPPRTGAPFGMDRSSAVADGAEGSEPGHQPLPPSVRQLTGSRWSSTSSTVTAPTSRPTLSHTATPMKL